MKVEQKTICEILTKAREECRRPVDDSHLLADMNDKFFNFGVDHMFYVVTCKLYDLEKVMKEVEI